MSISSQASIVDSPSLHEHGLYAQRLGPGAALSFARWAAHYYPPSLARQPASPHVVRVRAVPRSRAPVQIGMFSKASFSRGGVDLVTRYANQLARRVFPQGNQTPPRAALFKLAVLTVGTGRRGPTLHFNSDFLNRRHMAAVLIFTKSDIDRSRRPWPWREALDEEVTEEGKRRRIEVDDSDGSITLEDLSEESSLAVFVQVNRLTAEFILTKTGGDPPGLFIYNVEAAKELYNRLQQETLIPETRIPVVEVNDRERVIQEVRQMLIIAFTRDGSFISIRRDAVRIVLVKKDIIVLSHEVNQLTRLKEMLLSGNQLTELPPDVGQWTQLTNIDLDDNMLRSLPPEVEQWRQLRVIGLTNNRLISLTSAVGNWIHLTIIRLANNGLPFLPGAIRRWTQLTSITLSGNRLTLLPTEVGRWTQLESITLGGNLLTELPSEVGQWTALKELGLGINGLTLLPPEIGQLTALEELSLGGNNLTSLPPEIGQLTALKILFLANNNLTSLPPEIGQLAELRAFILGANRLTSLPPEVEGWTRLEEIDLGHNQLTLLPPGVGQWTRLEFIVLTDNRLSSLPSAVGQWTQLERIWLAGNPLTRLPAEARKWTQLRQIRLPTTIPRESFVRPTEWPPGVQVFD